MLASLKRRRVCGMDRTAGDDFELSTKKSKPFIPVQVAVPLLRPTQVLDPYPKDVSSVPVFRLQRDSKIQEMMLVQDMLITVQSSGVCAVFSQRGNGMQVMGYLNGKENELVRSVFYNRVNEKIVLVSVFPEDRYEMLRCRSIDVQNVRCGVYNKSVPILIDESLGHPGWVEFCDSNSRIFSCSGKSTRKTHKVWDLQDYSLKFQVPVFDNVDPIEVKASPGFLLLMYSPIVCIDLSQKFRMERQDGDDESASDNDEIVKNTRSRACLKRRLATNKKRTQRIRLLDVRDGVELFVYDHALTTEIEFVEQFGDSVLIKEVNHGLSIKNIRYPDQAIRLLQIENLMAFTFLHTIRTFLAFETGGRVVSFEENGKTIAVLHDRAEKRAKNNCCNTVVIARDFDTLVCLRTSSETRANDENQDVFAGNRTRSNSQVNFSKSNFVEFTSCSTGQSYGRISMDLLAKEPTCVCFDDKTMTLYVGTRGGLVHVWN